MWPLSILARINHGNYLLPTPSTAGKSRRSSLFTLSVILAIIYTVAFLAVRATSYRDPTSIFFRPDIGYEADYSTQRKQQADAYINNVDNTGAESLSKFNLRRRHDSICVGIATIARKDVNYFPSMVGSILQGLRPSERERIYLMPFIAHSDPKEHSAYSQPWLGDLSDQVLIYNISKAEREHIARLEKNQGYREKALLDYTYLLKACVDMGSPYIAMLEDDVLAMDGWFHRTRNALSQIEKSSDSKNSK
jgi:hypothetical protein